jgi:hypothetical protein
MVKTTVTGSVRPPKSIPEPFTLKLNILAPSGTIFRFKVTPLMVLLQIKVPVAVFVNEPDGIVTEKVPICRVSFWVVGVIPLLFAPRVKESDRWKVESSDSISSVTKDEANGTSGVIANEMGAPPVAKGEPESWVRAR